MRTVLRPTKERSKRVILMSHFFAKFVNLSINRIKAIKYMNKNIIMGKVLGAVGILSMSLGFAMPAAAQIDLRADLKVRANANLETVVKRSDASIDARINALTKLKTRVNSIKRISDTEKASINGEVASEIASLHALRAKIRAQGSVEGARADEKSIAQDHRIYMLVIPQGYILGAADRINVIAEDMTALSVKINARIAAAKAGGIDTTSMEAKMSDVAVKIKAASDAGANAKAKVSGLVPDKGDATLAASNKAAIESARADIKVASENFVESRIEIKSVIQDLKK